MLPDLEAGRQIILRRDATLIHRPAKQKGLATTRKRNAVSCSITERLNNGGQEKENRSNTLVRVEVTTERLIAPTTTRILPI
jgi:hypothetical protein